MHKRLVGTLSVVALCFVLAGCVAGSSSTSHTDKTSATPLRGEESPGQTRLQSVAPAASAEDSRSPLPRGGISLARAVQLASQHESNPAFLSAAAGPFARVNAISSLGPGWDPDRLVWAIRFEVTGGPPACPPPQPSGPNQDCAPLGPRTVMVILDYYTGAFIVAGGLVE